MNSENSEVWIEHDGGPCPVDADEWVVVKFPTVDAPVPMKAGALVWGEDGFGAISHYRVVKP